MGVGELCHNHATEHASNPTITSANTTPEYFTTSIFFVYDLEGRRMSGDGSVSSLPWEVRAQSSTRSLESLMNLELVWNRQRGGRGSLTVGEVMDALAGPQSQVSCSYWWEQKKCLFFSQSSPLAYALRWFGYVLGLCGNSIFFPTTVSLV